MNGVVLTAHDEYKADVLIISLLPEIAGTQGDKTTPYPLVFPQSVKQY